MDFSKFRNESCICIEIGHGEKGMIEFASKSCRHFEFEMNAHPERSELDRVMSGYFKTIGIDALQIRRSFLISI